MWKSFRGLAAENVEKFPWEDVRRPLAATRVAAAEKRMLAATCGHSSGCKWLQVAAGDKRMLAATCGHLRPLEWQQVAAISKIKLRASCVLNVFHGKINYFDWAMASMSLFVCLPEGNHGMKPPATIRAEV